MKKNLIDFPADELNLVYTEIEQAVSAFFDAHIEEEKERYEKFLDTYTAYYKDFEEKIGTAANNDQLSLYFFENSKHRNQVLELLETLFKEKNEVDQEALISSLQESCYQLLEALPDEYYSRQKEERFMASKDDRRWIRTLKKTKRALRQTQTAFASVYNFPVKLFGGKPIEIVWKQRVELKKIVTAQFILASIQEQNRAISDFYLGMSSVYLGFWKADSLINERIQNFLVADFDLESFKAQLTKLEIIGEVEKSRKKLKEYSDAFKKSVDLNYSTNKEKVAHLCDLSGTLERRRSQDHISKIEHTAKKNVTDFTHLKARWGNTYFVLSEDWKLDLEIFSTTCLIYKDFFDFAKTVNSRLTEELRLKIKEFSSIVSESEVVFEKIKSNDATDLKKNITQLRTYIKKELLLNLVPFINNLILQAKIPEYFESVEKLMRQQLDKLSTKRLLLKSSEYNRPILLSEAESISPLSLVTFEMMPRFMQVFPTLKSNYINFIGILQNEIEEIPEILDFSLDSTLKFFEGSKDKEEALKISSEGFSRVAKKSEEINDRLIETLNSSGNTLRSAIDEFAMNLLKVTDNENALQIKFRITKAKAIEKAKAIRQELIDKIKNFIPVLLNKLKNLVNLLRRSSLIIKEHLAENADQGFVSTEVSDYLTETEAAINKLPFIYQRLFKIEPLDTFELYIDRDDPIGKLKNAHDKWKEGKFAPVVVIGEKGCGKTSLIRKYGKLYLPEEKVVYIDLHQKVQDPKALYNEIEKAANFAPGNEASPPEPLKKIIVVDGLEKLFISQVDGFMHIKKAFHLMSETNSNIFWIYTCHEYSWNYLDQCTSASDFFGYHIKLRDITDEALKKIILKRNSISGYKLVFNPGVQVKSFSIIPKRKLVPEQKDLEKAYFSQLNAITGGNIAIALLYWMRSTEKVTEDTIYIGSLSNLNLQFVKSISKLKMVTIRSLIIHNGLSTENYAMSFRIAEEKGNFILTQLLNDGILQLNDDIYRVNPMIYSQIINHLKLLNLLS